MPMLRSIAPTAEKPDPDYRMLHLHDRQAKKQETQKASMRRPETAGMRQVYGRLGLRLADEVSPGSGLLPPHFPSKPKTTLSGTFAPFSHPMVVQERGHLRPSQGDSSWHSFGSPAYSQLCCSRPYQCLPDTGFRKTRFYLFFFPAAEHLVLRRLRHGAISVERSGADNL
jgi:hypothetical protein